MSYLSKAEDDLNVRVRPFLASFRRLGEHGRLVT